MPEFVKKPGGQSLVQQSQNPPGGVGVPGKVTLVMQQAARRAPLPATNDRSDDSAGAAAFLGSSSSHAAASSTHVVSAESQRRGEAIGRYERAYEVANSAAKRVFEFLAPDYVMARDQLNVTKVADLGGMLIGRFGLMHGAMAALEEIRPTLPHNSVSGVDADQSQEEFQRCETIDRRMPALQQRIQQADARIASALTPHQFRHEEVAGQRVVLELAGTFEQQNATLTAELQRTIELLQTTRELIVTLTTRKRGLDPATVDKARGELARWSGRPLDLAFMRAALGPLWKVLDTAAGGPLSAKPGDLMTKATRQVEETGWLGDAGRFDIDAACEHLYVGGRLMAELVIGDLNTADPNTRAKLLVQIQERGLLHQLCSPVGWEQIKNLHDHLGYGFPQIKHALRPYFIGTDKFGPSPDREWEHHTRSAHAAISRWGHIGHGLNVALDVTTFGFHSSYGQALDERAQGSTSESEASNARAHAAMRTAVTTIVSTLTAGVADKAVRGGATTVSTGRAMASGAAAGSLGAGTTVATSDAYNNYIAGTQNGASSMKDYVTAMLLGGGIGAGFGALANRSSRKSAAGAAEEAPAVESPIAGPFREPSPPLAAAAEKAGFDLRALQPPQRDLLDAAEASLASGDHYGSVKQFDQLVASGVPKHSVDALETELAQTLGKTARLEGNKTGSNLLTKSGNGGTAERPLQASNTRADGRKTTMVHDPVYEEAHSVNPRPTRPRLWVKESDLNVYDRVTSKEWKFFVEAPLPGGRVEIIAQGEVELGANLQPIGGPEFYFEKRTTIAGKEHRITIGDEHSGTTTSLSDFALDRATRFFKIRYGHEPTELPGHLAFDNKANFHREYLLAIDRGLSQDAAEIAAVEAISFGRARLARGYVHFEVFTTGTETVLHGDPPVLRAVPRSIDVKARRK